MKLLPNLRTGEQGYKWGPQVKYSYILDAMGIVNRQTGEVLEPTKLAALGLTPETNVAEYWHGSDDIKYPSWIVEKVEGVDVALPLFWVLRFLSDAALGKEHCAAFGQSIGMVAKYLDAAEPLSGQMHIGITEGYLVIEMNNGAGLFLGVNDPMQDTSLGNEARREVRRKDMIDRVIKMIEGKDPRVVRWPQEGVEVHFRNIEEAVDTFVIVISNGQNGEGLYSWSIAELLKFLLISGMNIVDVAGFGVNENGLFDAQWSLVQAITPNTGDLIKVFQFQPHALYGSRLIKARGTFLEFKATSTGDQHAKQSSAEQTESLGDNYLGKIARVGKVTFGRLIIAFEKMEASRLWRKTSPEDYKANGDEQPVVLAPGVTKQRLHEEEQYTSTQYRLASGTAIELNRFGQHSVFWVRAVIADEDVQLHGGKGLRNGRISIETITGRKLIELGVEEEAFVFADQGDLVIRSVGNESVVFIEFKRPVPGMSLPEAKPVVDNNLARHHAAIAEFNAKRIEAGSHSQTEKQNHFGLAPELIVDLMDVVVKGGFIATTDRMDVLKGLRAKNPSAVIGYFATNVVGLREAAATGATFVIMVEFSPTADEMTRIRTEFPALLVIAELDTAAASSFTQSIRAVVEIGVDGVVLKHWSKVPAALQKDNYSVTQLRKDAPNLIIIPAGGIFENKVAAVLAIPEKLVAAVGFNAKTVEECQVQVKRYHDAINAPAQSAAQKDTALKAYHVDAQRTPLENAYLGLVKQQVRAGFITRQQIEEGITSYPIGNDYIFVISENRIAYYQKGISIEKPSFGANILANIRKFKAYGIYLAFKQVWRDVVLKPLFKRNINIEFTDKNKQGQPSGKCNLCPAFLPVVERGIPLARFDEQLKDWIMYVNPFFWGVDDRRELPSFVIVHRKHNVYPSFTEIVRVGDVLSRLMPHTTINWNGPARSVNYHAHFQGVFRHFPIYYKELAPGVRAHEQRVEYWPATNFIYEGKDDVKYASERISGLLARGIKENMIDLAWVISPQGLPRIYIFPRSKRIPAGMIIPYGVPELSGYNVTAKEELPLFDLSNPQNVKAKFEACISEVSVPLENIQEPAASVPAMIPAALPGLIEAIETKDQSKLIEFIKGQVQRELQAVLQQCDLPPPGELPSQEPFEKALIEVLHGNKKIDPHTREVKDLTEADKAILRDLVRRIRKAYSEEFKVFPNHSDALKAALSVWIRHDVRAFKDYFVQHSIDQSNNRICIHTHDYQPDRRNPWRRGIVEKQESAKPYHDWNARVTAECYAPNTAARILGPGGHIVDIVNNYSKCSFNFGATLLEWMEEKDPEIYEAILAADLQSQLNYSGHGSAIAQVYNHMIMPLANTQDKRAQIIWGIKDFESRFNREPEGMWLAETAVDMETLDLMAQQGIKFTILAPRQAKQIRQIGQEMWQDVSGGKVDPRVPYLCNLPSGRQIYIFFYDGGISQAVAFEHLLDNGEKFAGRLMKGLGDSRPGRQTC